MAVLNEPGLQKDGSVIVECIDEIRIPRMGSKVFSNIELVNKSELWMIYMAKCNKNHESCLISNLTGLLGPHERRFLTLAGVTTDQNDDLVLNLPIMVAVCLETNKIRTDLNADKIWKTVVRKDRTLISLRDSISKMYHQVDIRSVICFLPLKKMEKKDIVLQLQEAYENEAPCKATVYNWIKEVSLGRNNVFDCERSGRPQEIGEEKIENSLDFVKQILQQLRSCDIVTPTTLTNISINMVPNPKVVIRKSVSGRMQSVLKRTRQEDLVTDGLLILLALFGVGAIVGYMSRKNACQNVGNLCTNSHFL